MTLRNPPGGAEQKRVLACRAGFALVAVICLCLVLAVWLTRRDPTGGRVSTARSASPTAKLASQSSGRLEEAPRSTVTDPDPTAAAAATLTGDAAREQLRKSGQYESLGAAFQAARYAADKIDPAGPHSRGGAEYFAANPGQELRAWFRRDGVELAGGGIRRPQNDRLLQHSPTALRGLLTAENDEPQRPPWSVGVRLRGHGREGAMIEPGSRTVQARNNRVELADAASGLTEWYENLRDGVEQGFTVNGRPEGSGDLAVVLAVEGDLWPEIVDGAETVHFFDENGEPVMEYGGLKAFDAAGRVLPARFAVHGTQLALLVDDRGAQYPVTIDPLFANLEARLVQESANGAIFGSAVAVDVDTAIIGAVFEDTPAGIDAGTAYVFVRSGTNWSQQARLTVTNAVAFDNFGGSVAVSGNTALVGIPYRDSPTITDTGSTAVFVRSGSTWTQQAELVASDRASADFFGYSVALSGNTGLVGAPGDDTAAGVDAGSAYVFLRSGTTWTQQAKLACTDPDIGENFGWAVAISGETALVGATWDVDSPFFTVGAAYAFLRVGATWSQQAKLVVPDAGLLGYAVAISSNTAVVGAPFSDTVGGTTAGKAAVFIRNGTSWSLQANLLANDGSANDRAGFSVSISGETIVIGADNADAPAANDAGGAYVFTRSGATWSQQAKLTSSDATNSNRFGYAVALSGTTLLVGEPRSDTFSSTDGGSAAIFVRNGTTWTQQVKLAVGSTLSGANMGFSVALAGQTALVGAIQDNTPAANLAGSAYVFVRSGSGWIQQAKLFANEGESFDYFGLAVALFGETALVGAPSSNPPAGLAAGSTFVFVRSGTTWSQQAKLTASDGAADHEFGWSVALSGDTALVGAPEILFATGAAYVYVRNGTSWSEQTKLTADVLQTGGVLGISVALDGNTALVGSPGASDPASAAGNVYVFVRSGTAWSQQARLFASTGEASAAYGHSVALSGNTAAIGALNSNTPLGTDVGSVYVLVRNGTSWSEQAKLTATDGMTDDALGKSVALDGDLLLAGANFADTNVVTNTGAAYLFSRVGTVWSQQLKLTSGIDASAGDLFGASVALSGDTALVGASRDDANGSDSGAVYTFRIGHLPQITQQPASRTVVPGQAVTFTVAATGYAPLRYQWRKDGFEIAGASGPSYTIPSVTAANAGSYDVVVSNVGGTATSAAAVLAVNALSQFTQQFPSGVALEGRQGFAIVNLNPTAIGAGWRFVGEQQWRASGVPVSGLTTGDRTIEFRPVPGYIQPPPEPVSVISGGPPVVISRDYFLSGSGTGTASLSVTLKPDALADAGVPEAARAQWRLLAVSSTEAGPWLNTQEILGGLFSGNYLVECKPVAGRSTPPPVSVEVQDGQTSIPTIIYYLADSPTGAPPGVLPFETVSTSQNLPYAYVGQIRSGVGSSTGFVVRPRVIATAGHVVFDDASLSAVRDLQWLFQRDRGSYEPVPQIPRGSYLLSGYSAQRALENTPGSSSPESQTLDAAALWFVEDASRGGFGGYLASDADNNEWLTTLNPATLKTLVGYPVDGIPAANQGRMHATPPLAFAFTHPPGAGHIYATDVIRSAGGNSGGPLCVQFEGGNYYPAAIFLGGSAQTIMRAIDSDVIQLFDLAELSSVTGENSTSGGVTSTENSVGGSAAVAQLQIYFEGAGSALANARWNPGDGIQHTNGQIVSVSVSGNPYTVQFPDVSPYLHRNPYNVTVTGGIRTTITVPYNGIIVHPNDKTRTAFDNVGFSVTVSGYPTGYQWRRSGVDIPGATSSTFTIPVVHGSDAGNYRVVVTWDNGSQTSAAGTLTVTPLGQTISFPKPPNRLLRDGGFDLSATSSSDRTVEFSVGSGPATLGPNGVTLTPTGPGMVTVRASLDGTANGNYSAAPDVVRSFNVSLETLDSWRGDRFTATEFNNPLISGPTADPERDGTNNLLEFGLNLDPKLSDRVTMEAGIGLRGLPLIARESVAPFRATAEFVRRRAAALPGITYRFEFSSDASSSANWTVSSGESVTPIDDKWERVKVTDTVGNAAARFGRLVVTGQ